MTDAKKQAEAVVKAAQKAYDAAAKKADDALAKYRPLRADANRKARELAHAETNPDLFDDDPLTVVAPEVSEYAVARHNAGGVTTVVQGGTTTTTGAESVTTVAPVADVTFDHPITVDGTQAEERGVVTYEEQANAQHAEDLADVAPQPPTMDPGDAATGDPWDQPRESVVETPAPAKRKRRTKAEMEAARAAEAAAKETADYGVGTTGVQPTLDDPNAESDAIDGDAVAPVFADPFATQAPVAPLAVAPVADVTFQVPEGHVHIGFDANGNPTFAKLQPQPAAPVGQAPVIKPPF